MAMVGVHSTSMFARGHQTVKTYQSYSMVTTVTAMRASEVKAELLKRGVNTSMLIEKQEFQDALRAARYYEADSGSSRDGPPTDWAPPSEGDTIEVEIADGTGATSWVKAKVTTVQADGSFTAKITTHDDEWDDEFTWSEEGSDWRRNVAAMKLSQVKAELLRRGVSIVGLLEKQEYFEALVKARAGGGGAKRPAADDAPAPPKPAKPPKPTKSKRPAADDAPSEPKPAKPPKPAKLKRPAVDDDAKHDSSKKPEAVADASAGPYAGWRRKLSTKKNEGRYYLVSPDGKTKVWEDTLDPAEQPGKQLTEPAEQPGTSTKPGKAQKRPREPDDHAEASQPQPQPQLAAKQPAQGTAGEGSLWKGRGGILAAQASHKLAGEVEVVVRMADLETLTPKMVRARLEERLGLPPGSLKPQKDAISEHIDRVLRAIRAEGEAQSTPEYGV